MESKTLRLIFLTWLFIISKICDADATVNDTCELIDLAFANTNTTAGLTAEAGCWCMQVVAFGVAHELTAKALQREKERKTSSTPAKTSDNEKPWIGCTGSNIPKFLRSLDSINKTRISHLHVWSSAAPLGTLNRDYFQKIQPAKLTIEDSGLNAIEHNAFENIAHFIESITLPRNYIKQLDAGVFSSLNRLNSLDLSSNELIGLKEGIFNGLESLETLLISNNRIDEIGDGVFSQLGRLKALNLANNKITTIKGDAFKRLVKLEILDLSGNELKSLDSQLFAGLKSLKVLNLGSNKLEKIELKNLPNLEHLLLNNNSLSGMEAIELEKLPQLTVLNMDSNKISKIGQKDLMALSGSRKLASLSLSENAIAEIECRSFAPVSSLLVLSLQSNNITSLSCKLPSPKQETSKPIQPSLLVPLTKIKRLFLSYNKIEAVRKGDLNVIPSLKELALDHNFISDIDKEALEGLQLTKLFLNNNQLKSLPSGIFSKWNANNIAAIDIGENPWNCECEHEWVGHWLKEAGLLSADTALLQCLIKCNYPPVQNCSTTAAERKGLITTCNPVGEEIEEPTKKQTNDFWMTAIACTLTAFVLVLLTISGWNLIKKRCHPLGSISLTGKIPSDMIHLIPSEESLMSFPNPIIAAGLGGGDLIKPHATKVQPIPTISITVNEQPAQQNRRKSSTEKKKVRFDDS